MTRVEALRELHRILDGIDRDDQGYNNRDEPGQPDGWWPTSVGVDFGAARLVELEQLICALT